jgi:hypothetical protein
MTMKRSAKEEINFQLSQARGTGFTEEQFHHPQRRRAAVADRGHAFMTGPEYRTFWMLRSKVADQETARSDWGRRTRRARRLAAR